MTGGAWVQIIQNTVLGVTAVSVFSGMAAQLGGEEENGIGFICGLCIAGCILDAVGNVLEAFM